MKFDELVNNFGSRVVDSMNPQSPYPTCWLSPFGCGTYTCVNLEWFGCYLDFACSSSFVCTTVNDCHTLFGCTLTFQCISGFSGTDIC